MLPIEIVTPLSVEWASHRNLDIQQSFLARHATYSLTPYWTLDRRVFLCVARVLGIISHTQSSDWLMRSIAEVRCDERSILISPEKPIWPFFLMRSSLS